MSIILANKYFPHSKSGLQLVDYSKDSILLNDAKKDNHFFLPKSSVNILHGKNGNVDIDIPDWLIKQKEGLENY